MIFISVVVIVGVVSICRLDWFEVWIVISLELCDRFRNSVIFDSMVISGRME